MSTATTTKPLLDVRDLRKHFVVEQGGLGTPRKVLRAVDGVSLHVNPGETLGLVGESGCGKSTTGRCLVRLLDATSGSVRFDGQELTTMGSGALRQMRRHMQFIFQDPFSSMNPRMRVRDIIGEPLRNFGVDSATINQRVSELLERVSLRPDAATRYPHEFSGGQRQRIVVARALALKPKLIICDEPVSALDVSVQAQVINLLRDLQRDMNLSYVFISHDLSVVRYISHRVAVMYLGHIVESGPREAVFQSPTHPYTQALLSAVPEVGKRNKTIQILKGEIPSPMSPPSGCAFRTRCPKAQAVCAERAPEMKTIGDGHQAACHFV